MTDPRDLLSSYREVLGGLRRGAGPAGALPVPLQLTADVLEQVLARQADLEARLNSAIQPLVLVSEVTREAPAMLRTQAKAFEVASVSFGKAAEAMERQADLLERTLAVLDAPKDLIRSVRSAGNAAPPDPEPAT